MEERKNELVEQLVNTWNRPFITRDSEEIREATGAKISVKTLANLDCQGKGPKGKRAFGRRVVYDSRNFFEWFAARLQG